MTGKEALEKLIRWVMRDTVWLATYHVLVASQNDDGTVDLLRNANVPGAEGVMPETGMQNVPIRHGLPGVTVRAAVGATVLLGFENGDPQGPYVTLFGPDSIEEISFDGGKRPVARKGDPVVFSWPPNCDVTVAGITGPLTGSSFAGKMTIAAQSAGIIDGGSDKVKA